MKTPHDQLTLDALSVPSTGQLELALVRAGSAVPWPASARNFSVVVAENLRATPLGVAFAIAASECDAEQSNDGAVKPFGVSVRFPDGAHDDVRDDCALHVPSSTSNPAQCRVVVPPSCAFGVLVWPSAAWSADDATPACNVVLDVTSPPACESDVLRISDDRFVVDGVEQGWLVAKRARARESRRRRRVRHRLVEDDALSDRNRAQAADEFAPAVFCGLL